MRSRLVAIAVLGTAWAAPEIASACSPVPPRVPLSIAMQPASPSAGAEVQLTGGAGADSYTWDLDGDGRFGDAVGKAVTTRFPAGERTVRAQASTPLGLLTDTRTFTVHSWNGTPTGTIEAEPYSARVGAPVKITAEGRDPDGSRVQAALDLDGDGTFETAGSTGTTTFPAPGERVIRARFTDEAGATSAASVTVDVHARNIAPSVRIQPGSSCGPDRAEADDPDGEIVRYEFDYDGDGVYETDAGRNPALRWAPARGVRVTDDAGATATARADDYGSFRAPSVVEVGKPVTLSRTTYGDAAWDADGDGAFDDGTGSQITFTYPAVGTYTARVRDAHSVSTFIVSVREPADIGVPRAVWQSVAPASPSARTLLTWNVRSAAGAVPALDLDGDGRYGDAPAQDSALMWAFGGPATVALKATGPGGTSVTTTQVPFSASNFGPDASLWSSVGTPPLQLNHRLADVSASGQDTESSSPVSRAWDTDGDGEFDDPGPSDENAELRLASSFGLRVTDIDGATTTVRRAVGPESAAVPTPLPRPWLQLSAKRPRLATLLRRGMTVDVRCARPKCRTKLTAKVDPKTARKLRLRAQTVASRTVTGTKRVTLKLTPKARKALQRVKSVKLTVTAKATADGGQRSTATTTLTIRRTR